MTQDQYCDCGAEFQTMNHVVNYCPLRAFSEELVSLRNADVSADLTNPVFQGVYEQGKKYHDPDLDHVLQRAWNSRVKTILIPGKTITHSEQAIKLANKHENVFTSVGISPKYYKEFETNGKRQVLESMMKMIKKNPLKVLAVGECGLDFTSVTDNRDKVSQMKYFQLQIEIAKLNHLPMLIRCRNGYDEIIKLLGRDYNDIPGGVVLGFDGSDNQARRLQRIGFHIGISGSSLNSKEQREVLYTIPAQSLVYMTESPNSMIDSSTFGQSRYLKTTFSTELKTNWTLGKRVTGRNEPANIMQILEVTAAVRNESIDNLAYLANKACEEIFFSKYKSYSQKIGSEQTNDE